MMDDKKKKGLLIAILGKAKEKANKESEEEKDTEESKEEPELNEEEAMASEVLSAMQRADATDLAEALKNFIEYCGVHKEEEEE